MAENLPVFCPKCKIQSILDIEPDFKIKVITHIV
nr:cysteine-rich KTR domain-containing protein [Blautia hydrogenotrophica]